MELTFEKALQNILLYKRITSQGDKSNSESSMSSLELLTSFKLDIALRYFNTIQNDGWLSRLKFVASHWDTGYSMYWNYFKPEPKTSSEQNNISLSNSNSGTVESFLNRCVEIGKEDPNYWSKISQLLDLKPEKINQYLKRITEKEFVKSENGYEVVVNQYYF